MDDVDRALEALKVHIKKEIIDNFFADRVYLEEEIEILGQDVQSYQQEWQNLSRRFVALYQALGSETAIARVTASLGLTDRPCYQQFQASTEQERQALLQGVSRHGLTAYRRFRNLIFDLYDRLQRDCEPLQEHYGKIMTHLKLLNEDIDKFNLSYDFGLIAAQIEALEGRGDTMGGGLLAPEREELSTRMRFKRRKLTEEELPPVPPLPPLKEIRPQLADVLEQVYRP